MYSQATIINVFLWSFPGKHYEHHGNTKKIASAIAKVLNARIVQASRLNISNLKKYDLVGFGSGIYDGGYHKDLLKILDRLPEMKKKAFVFSTSGSGFGLFNMFKNKVNNKLKEKGFRIIGEFSCRGFDTNGILGLIGGLNRGRPNKNDLKSAQDFARDLKKKLL
jgi:flavodoxin